MARYTLRRLLQLLPVFFGTTFLIYTLVWAIPGDPLAGQCGDRGCPDAFIARMTEKFHLDQPLVVQYFYYMKGLLSGDFGETQSGQQVGDLIAQAYPVTVKLALVAIAIEALIGISAGILSAIRRGSYVDNLVLVSTLFLISLPVFVLGNTLRFYLGNEWGIIKPVVSSDPTFSELIVPGFVLAAASMATVSRLTRVTFIENRRSDYVRTAIAKGLPRRRVTGVHLLRNSLIPVVTFLGIDLGALMGGAIVTEGIFNIRGIGGLLYAAIGRKESSLVVSIVVVLVIVYLVANLFVDLLYGVLDPRIRYE